MNKLPFDVHIIEEISGNVRTQVPLYVAVLVSLCLGYLVSRFDNSFSYWLDEYYYNQENGLETRRLELKLLRLRVYKYIFVVFTFVSWVVVYLRFHEIFS